MGRLRRTMEKVAFGGLAEKLEQFAQSPEALAILGGTATGIGAGRALAGHTAAGLAARGRKGRSEDIARRAAFIAAPVGSILALALARKRGWAPLAQLRHANRFPRGVIADPATEQALLKYLVPAGVAAGGGVAGGLATGATVGGIQRLRGSIYKTDREKEASDGGQDLRAPIVGGMKFPTNDSKQFAKKQFDMASAEVGPVQPSTKGSKIQDIIPKYGSARKTAASKRIANYQQTRKGKRPIRVHNLVKKAGDPMDPILTDPLVRYLKKQAADGPVEDNLESMPTAGEETNLTSACPCPTEELREKSEEEKSEASGLFDSGDVKPKCMAKDHEKAIGGVTEVTPNLESNYAESVVNRVLGLS